MNRNILIAAIIILTSLLSAQTKESVTPKSMDLLGIEVKGNSFFLKLNDKNYRYTDKQQGKFTIRDYVEFTDPAKIGEYKLPARTFLIALPPGEKPLINLVNSREEVLQNIVPELNLAGANDKNGTNKNDYTKLKKKVTAKPVLEITGYTWYRNYYCAVVKINDISFNELTNQLVIEKEIKLEVKLQGNENPVAVSPVPNYDNEINDLIVNYEMAGQFRGNPKFGIADTTGNWFNYSQPYVKIGTGFEGLYKIYKSDLGRLGVDTLSIDPRTFQLFESGKEQNIYVSNVSSGVFGDSDYVEFFGTRNFPKISPKIINADNEEYNEYLNRYTDTSYYFLTWGAATGKRAYTLSTPALGIADTLNYFSSVIHHEPNTMLQYLNSNDELANQTPNWYKNKSLYWDFLGISPAIVYDTLQLKDIYPGKIAKVSYKLVSSSSSVSVKSHNITFSVNNLLVDSEVVDLNKQVVLQGNVSSDNLINGPNLYSLHNYENGTDPNSNFLARDWYEIEYPKILNLAGDSLYFELRDNFTNNITSVKVINASLPLNSYEIFKVKPFLKKIDNAQIIDGNIFFSDTINTNDAYVIINSNKITKPDFLYKKNFVDLRKSRQTDYVAITHPSFMSGAQTYVNTIAQLYSVNTSLININDIFDEFAFGYPYPQSIKDFIGNSLQNWQSPLPSYLLLIGDADYDYKFGIRNSLGIIGGGNYIPSYGSPVSDIWYSVLNDTISLPQMKVGRIPINNLSDLNFYLSKVQNNFNAPFNDWNKHFLFFSGGDPDLPYQLDLFKMINDSIITTYVKPKPLAGTSVHFYKTIDPPTNFGPYTAEQFNSAISSGAVFISYLGHSGTSTWDDGIAFINDLKNDVNRNPLITDFGCSTNKFAEPDIVCFGEGFILSGQAIGYIANSSLGFTSTAITAPLYFYSSIIQDSIYQIGQAHLAAKKKMFNDFGPSSVFKIFSLNNTLLGDPIVNINIPTKPNFSITPSDILISNKFINEAIDSVEAYIVINNFGTSINDSVRVDISHSLNNIVVQSKSLYLPIPDYKDTISIWLKTGHLPGDHILTVTINGDNRIPEIYTTDNTVSYKFSVESIEVNLLFQQKIENSAFRRIKFLNPTISQLPVYNYVYQLSNDGNFTNPKGSIISDQTFFTNLVLPNLVPGQRYWFRIKVDGLGTNYSEPISFLNSGTSKYLLNDQVAFDNQLKDSLVYLNGSLILGDSVRISVISAGTYAGPLCKISKNGVNLLSSSLFSGLGIVVFDPITLNPDTSTWYNLFNNFPAIQQLTNLINSIPAGKIVAMGVCDDAAKNYSQMDRLRIAIKSLGSTQIDQLAFRGSWALIGRKGAAPGTVLEELHAPFNGLVSIDTVFIKKVNAGNFVTTSIGPSSHWTNLIAKQNIPTGTEVKYKLLGIKQDNTIDTLGYVSIIDSIADLSFIDAKKYPHLKILGEINIGTGNVPPSISSLGVNYDGVPELGTNYQAVTISADTFNVGKTGFINFYVYNAGDIRADSVKVIVNV
ncbi:MAG: C25 family cysteine peptidase, partial [Ignavibacteriaceae bacterium]|nr:C25 family cysteine peptidase [Ignavibacteriaceae bacterium]